MMFTNKTCTAIQGKVNAELGAKYMNTRDIQARMPVVYDFFEKCISSPEVLQEVVFANDILGVPPVKTFLLLFQKVSNGTKNFSTSEAQQIGALWGFVFRFCLGYQKAEKPVRLNNLFGIKSATLFVKTGTSQHIKNWSADYFPECVREKLSYEDVARVTDTEIIEAVNV